VPCFALGTVATGFLKSTVFLSALTSVVGLNDFFSDFFSAFFSGLAMLKTEVKVGALEGSVRAHKIKFGDWQGVTSAKTRFDWHVCSSCHHSRRPLVMSESEGNFDVIILGTGLVESIAAA
jgi:hypothetical protein